MSSRTNKTTLLGAIITLVAAFTISISAQTPDAVNSLTAKPDSAGGPGDRPIRSLRSPRKTPNRLLDQKERSVQVREFQIRFGLMPA